ncbi:hypothetical protein D3C87_1217650 [compost metagenome]
MELGVGFGTPVDVVQLGGKGTEQVGHALEIVVGPAPRGHCGGGAFQVQTQFVDRRQIGGIGAGLAGEPEPGIADARAHGAAQPLTALDHPLRAQVLGHLPDHGGADAVALGQLLAGGQAGANRIHAIGNLGAELLDDAFGEGDGAGCLHGVRRYTFMVI